MDDDNNSPDTRPFFTAALGTMGIDYDVFDTGGGNGPDLAGLLGYKMVFWFSGDAFGSTAGPNATDEANLTAYLDAGGNLFLSSQDYLYDWGLTPFGLNYLGIASFTSDSGDATSMVGLAGDPIGGGLGPFSLTYPSGYSDYGDIVNPATGASAAFKANNNANKLDVDKTNGTWHTVFFGTDWVALYNNNAANGVTVLTRIVDWFGGCEPPASTLHLRRLTIRQVTTTPPYQMAVQGIVHDEAHAVAPGVTVYGAWTLPNGSTIPRTFVSDALGRFKFVVRRNQCGLYQFDVTDLTKAGYVYDPGANHVPAHVELDVPCE